MNDFFFSSWATSREKACDYIKIGNRFEANILEIQKKSFCCVQDMFYRITYTAHELLLKIIATI